MYLLFDVGGSSIKYGVYSQDGVGTDEGSVLTPRTNYHDFLAIVTQIIKEKQNEIQLDGIGFSLPGKVDSDTGELGCKGGILKYLDTHNIIKDLKEIYNGEIQVENDGKAAALGEHWLGNLKGVQNGLMLTLGSGVGGGLILDNKLYRGSHFLSGEISFMNDGESNVTNRLGFGVTGSSVNLVNQIKALNDFPVETSGSDVFKAITPENKATWFLFESYCLRLANKIMDLQNVLDVEKVVIGGGVSAQPIVVETIKEKIRLLDSENKLNAEIPIVLTAHFGNNASKMGMLSRLIKDRK